MNASATAVLAVDTSGAGSGLALHLSGRVATALLEGDPPRGEDLAGRALLLLARQGVDLSAVGALAAVIGPGSFTGLRTGLAFVRGLAFRDGTPVAPVGSLELVAATRANDGEAVAVVAAFGSATFAAVYAREGDALIEMLAPAVAAETLETAATAVFERVAAVVATPGSEAAAETLGRRLGGVPVRTSPAADRLTTLGRLAAAKVAAGGVVAADDVLPTYVSTTAPRPNSNRVAVAPAAK